MNILFVKKNLKCAYFDLKESTFTELRGLFSTVNIEYRLKESMPVKITGRLTSGSKLISSRVGN